jgi:hypothetical protein
MTNGQEQSHPTNLVLLQLSEWDREKTYDEDPPRSTCHISLAALRKPALHPNITVLQCPLPIPISVVRRYSVKITGSRISGGTLGFRERQREH